MEARHKLKLLQKLFETRDSSVLGIPIKVAGEDGYVIGIRHATKDAILPLAFVLPDEVGEMFMDSEVFRGGLVEEHELEDEPTTTSSKATEGESGAASDSGQGESDVVAFMLGPEGMQPMKLPDEISAMLSGLGESLARLENLRQVREARKAVRDAGMPKPRVQQPSKDEKKGGVN